jgi:hypothetical protein
MRLRVVIISAILAHLAMTAMGSISHAAEAVVPPKTAPLVNALWLIHRYGTTQAIRPEQDADVKTELVRVLTKEKALTAAGVVNLMSPDTFARLAGEDGRLDAVEIERALATETPASRRNLFPQVEAHWLGSNRRVAPAGSGRPGRLDRRQLQAGAASADPGYLHGQFTTEHVGEYDGQCRGRLLWPA